MDVIKKIIFFLIFSQSIYAQEFFQFPLDPKAEQIKVLGDWVYEGYYYKKQFFLPSDPGMELTFSFEKENKYRLHWYVSKTNMHFCESKGNYTVDSKQLHTEILWRNPENHYSCASDPDMQVGRRATTDYQFNEDGTELRLLIPFSDEHIFYTLKKK